MKKALLLFAALLVAGCGEKSSSEGSESASEDPTGSRKVAKSSARTARPAPSKPRIAESSSKEPSNTPNSLSDADVERLLKEAVDRDSIEERDDLYYLPNESEPYSGWVKEMWDSGQVQILGQFKDGKAADGPFTAWHENGQKGSEGTIKDGKFDGLAVEWHENGQKKWETTLKDGKPDDLKTWWDENGQKEQESTYKDGKLNGLRTRWHENGHKWQESTFKDDEEHGLRMEWHGNGQKMTEATYKDGRKVSAKYWTSEGEEVETWHEARK